MDASHEAAPPGGGDPLAGDARTPEQLRRAQRLESLGRMAGGIAHDFNNVLGVILGYVELAKMNLQGADARTARHLELALSTLERARALSDRLLDFARVERRPLDVCDLNETVQAVRELLAETVDPRVRLAVALGADVPPVPLSAPELHQAVTNLCLNAAQVQPGGGRIQLETCSRRVQAAQPGGLRPGRYAVLQVRDRGPGVPRELAERIFDPWFTTAPAERSGLGLWVVRGLAERHGGRVEVGAPSEGGAVFTLWLPSELDVPAAGTAPPAAPSVPAPAQAARSVDVLVVADEPGVRDVTRAYLQGDGYRVRTAGSGAEAEAALAAHPGDVHVVLLDQRLPDARGADLAWKLQQLPHPPRIVVMTGLAGAAEAVSLPEGVRVLAKPYLREDLLALLRDDLGVRPRHRPSAG